MSGGRTRVTAGGSAQSGGRVRWYTDGLSSSASCTTLIASTPNVAGSKCLTTVKAVDR